MCCTKNEYHLVKGNFLQMLVPKKLQEEVATVCHDTLVGGNQGINKTFHKIKQRFLWYCLGHILRTYIRKRSVYCLIMRAAL